MNIRTLWLMTSLLLAATTVPSGPAFAVKGAATASQAAPRIRGVVVKDTPPAKRDREPAKQAPKSHRDDHAGNRSQAMARTSDRRQALRAIALEDRARQHEQAEVQARASRIYATSQVSAPILRDTSACKHIGAHGESIWENCALAPSSHELR